MKAGTAQKRVLNMLTTVTMLLLRYVKGNRMTNMKPSNVKLKERSFRILMAETELDEAAASTLFDDAGGDYRIALVMFGASASRSLAEAALKQEDFVIEKAIAAIAK